MTARFVRVRVDRPDGTAVHTTVTVEHADVCGLPKIGGRAVGRDGRPKPAKPVLPLGVPAAPAGGAPETTTEETA